MRKRKRGVQNGAFFRIQGPSRCLRPIPPLPCPSPDWQKSSPDIPFSSLICASPRSSPSVSQSPAHPTATAIQLLTADPLMYFAYFASKHRPLSFKLTWFRPRLCRLGSCRLSCPYAFPHPDNRHTSFFKTSGPRL